MGTAAQFTFLLAQFSPARGVASLFNLYENILTDMPRSVSHMIPNPVRLTSKLRITGPAPGWSRDPLEALQGCKSQYLQSKGAGWREETWPRTGHPCFPPYQAALLCLGPSQRADILTDRTKHF